MATFIVTTKTDELNAGATVAAPGGTGLSLREAVALANASAGADTITFDSTVFTGGDASFIRLTLGEIGISGAVTIDGSTATGVTISGDKNGNDAVVAGTHITDVAASGGTLADNSRIFNISSTTAATTLDSLTLTGGHTTILGGGGIGGAVKSNADLTIIDSVISGNSTTGDFAIGGAIYGRTIVTLNGTTVSDNSTAGVNAFGGGVYSSSTVILTDSTVSNNSTIGNASSGGGIAAITAVGSAGTVTLTNSTVSNNSTATDDSEGGGIYSNGSVTLTGSTVSGNSTAGAGADGGGISSITVNLTDSAVSGNSTTGSNANGGGIFGTDVTLTSSTIYGNSINSGIGGGVFGFVTTSLLNSTVTGNLVGPGFDTGGVFGTILTLTNSILLGNQGGADADYNAAILNINGGNIVGVTSNIIPSLIISDAAHVFAQTVDIGGGVLAGVLGNNGGPVQTVALRLDANFSNPAIDASNASAPTLDVAGQARVDLGNIANANGSAADLGALEAKEAPSLVVTTNLDVVNAFDGLISLREAVAFANSHVNANATTPDVITFDASVFTGDAASLIRLTQGVLLINDAVTIDGSTATGVTITGDKNGDDALVAGTNITDVAASYGGTPGAASDLLDDNSRIFNAPIFGTNVTLDGLTITGGRTTADAQLGPEVQGGAVFVNGLLTVLDSTVSGNSTAGRLALGGALRAFDIAITNSTVSNNATTGNSAAGGAIYSSTFVTLTNTTVSGNSTAGFTAEGGGILGDFGVNLINSTVTGNSALGGLSEAGGIYSNGPVVLTNSIVLGNNSAQTARDELFGTTVTANGLNIVGTGNDTNASDGIINADPTTVFAQTTDIDPGADVILAGVLANNGGPVQTIALKLDFANPALDRSNGSAPATDARGLARQDVIGVGSDVANFADLGAFEARDLPPTAVALANSLTSVAENTVLSAPLKVADIVVTDADGGANLLGFSGADASFFEIVGNALFLKAGTALNFEAKSQYAVSINVDGLLGSPLATDVSADFILTVLDRVETIRGTPRPDVLSGGIGADFIIGLAGDDRIVANAGNDIIYGNEGDDHIAAGAGNDTVFGNLGDDRIIGGNGDDMIRGGAGLDRMSGGGGAEDFIFRSASEASSGLRADFPVVRGTADDGAGLRDVIIDFETGVDDIDLSAIDANADRAGDQAFRFLGTGETNGAGSLIYRTFNATGTANDKTVIYGDINGDARIDFQIELTGIKTLTAADFVL